MDIHDISKRKEAHLALSLREEVRGAGCGLNHIRLPYQADFPISDEVLNTEVTIAGVKLQFPLIIGCMTGGTEKSVEFNRVLRVLAQKYGLGLGLGSIRAALANESLLPTYGIGNVDWLFGNIGISEVMHESYSTSQIRDVLSKLGCHGLYIHLNVIQEWIQPGGDHNLWIDIDKLARFINNIGVPVIIKEVGSGIGDQCAERLAKLSIAGLETASLGGTSWVKIEGLRNCNLSAKSIEALDTVGIPLEDAIKSCRKAMKSRAVIASGGIDSPLDIVKCIALGADAVSIAQPIYKMYEQFGAQAIENWLIELMSVTRMIWRSTGAKDLSSLKKCFYNNL